jgi:hypothetical protein
LKHRATSKECPTDKKFLKKKPENGVNITTRNMRLKRKAALQKVKNKPYLLKSYEK